MGNPTATNILLGGAIMYYALYGEAVPADSVVAGGSWGGTWARMGFTKAPLSLLYETTEMEVEVEEELTPIDETVITERMTVSTTLAELTTAYAGLITSNTPVVTPPGAGQVGKSVLNVGGDIIKVKYALGVEGIYRDSAGLEFPARVFVWKGTFKPDGALEFSKRSGEYAGIPFQFKALADPTKAVGSKLYRMEFISAVATS